MRDDDHGGGCEAAQERRAEEREDDLRQAGRFPFGYMRRWNETDITTLPKAPEGVALAVDPDRRLKLMPIPTGDKTNSREQSAANENAQRIRQWIDTDENGDLRGRVIADGVRNEPDADPTSEEIRLECDESAFNDYERAPMDPEEIRKAVESMTGHTIDPADVVVVTLPPSFALLPAAELFFAAACKATSAVRSDTTTTAGLEAAHRAARLAADLARRLEEELAVARDLRARQWPRECSCGETHSREGWQRLRPQGVQHDPSGDLDLRVCRCASTLAMPVSVL